jgi:hypothetical protein
MEEKAEDRSVRAILLKEAWVILSGTYAKEQEEEAFF